MILRGHMPCNRCFLYCNLGLVVSTVLMWLADSGSRSEDGGNHWISKWEDIILVVYTIIRIIRLIHIMSQVDALLKTLELQESAQRKAILLCSIVWCWATPSTRVCSGFTAIRFRRKCSTAVIEWTPSWFGRRASTMELSLCRQSQSGMLVYCSCSLLLLWRTLDPSPSIVPSCQSWKHMTILKMVIICIIHIIAIIAIISIYLHYDILHQLLLIDFL